MSLNKKWVKSPNYEVFFTEKCNLNCSYCFESRKNTTIEKSDLFSILDQNASSYIDIFGGEPLTEIDLVIDLIEKVRSDKYLSEDAKLSLVDSLKHHISNGTLIKKNLEKIKKYDMIMQISIDGPEEINDANRVYADGRGSFKDVLEAIQICKDNNVQWSIHGAISRNSIRHIFDIFKLFLELKFKDDSYKNARETANYFVRNWAQPVFEEDYSDDDIDQLMIGLEKIADYIMLSEDFNSWTEEDRKYFLTQFFSKPGSPCKAGGELITADSLGNLYSCHRMAGAAERSEYSMGNASLQLKNFEVNNAIDMSNRFRINFSSTRAVDYRARKNEEMWSSFCPATNYQNSGSAFFQASKFNLMTAEISNFSRYVGDKYGI